MAEVDVPYLINSTSSRLAQNDTASSVGSLSAFTLVKRFFTLPSRLAARVHLLEELLQEDPYVQAQAISSAYQANHNGEDAPRYSGRTPKPAFPNALGFFVSKYALSVVLMGFLLHRIYHIVTPSRRPPRGQRGSRRRSIFPLDLESTKTRLILRIPTLIALGRCTFLWLLVTFQTANLIPDNSLFDSLRQLALRTTTKNLCWQMHVSACCTVLVSAIFRGLDGPSRDSSRRPFNFAAFGYMMYIYSDPAAHVGKHEDGPSRPDIHVMIMAFLPFLELTLLHAMSVKYTWSWKRLYPTAFVSILTIVHYHYVVWFSSSNYPLLSFAGPFESVLIALILVVVGLRAFTQLVTTGSIRRPLLGSGTSLMPSADEDFVMALLRLGTVAMDTTSVAGLGNEVGIISTPETLISSRPARATGPGDTVQLGVGGVEVQRDPTSRRTGFGNEIRTVRAKVMDDIDTAQPSHLMREMTAFYKALWRFITGLGRYVSARVRGRPLVVSVPRMENMDPASPPPRPRNLRLEDEDRLYERFRMGQVDDDDEDEWTPPSFERETSLAPSELSEDDDGGNDSDATIDGDDLRTRETSELYSDHTAHPTSTSLLLAHLSNTSDAPLTRRRYRRLTLGESSHSRASDDDENDDNWLSERRKDAHTRTASKDDYEEARRRACVICTVEQRTIILWPCRCLALCEECRENMASRSGASKHSCPCCRQRVDGYSRVYIP